MNSSLCTSLPTQTQVLRVLLDRLALGWDRCFKTWALRAEARWAATELRSRYY